MCYISYLRETLPPFFPAPKLDKLTNGILCWRTIQNNRRKYPDACFSRLSPKKTLISRDALLNFIESESSTLNSHLQK